MNNLIFIGLFIIIHQSIGEYEGLYAMNYEINEVQLIKGPFPDFINPKHDIKKESKSNSKFNFDPLNDPSHLNFKLDGCNQCFDYCCNEDGNGNEYCDFCRHHYWYDCPPKTSTCNCNCNCNQNCPDCPGTLNATLILPSVSVIRSETCLFDSLGLCTSGFQAPTLIHINSTSDTFGSVFTLNPLEIAFLKRIDICMLVNNDDTQDIEVVIELFNLDGLFYNFPATIEGYGNVPMIGSHDLEGISLYQGETLSWGIIIPPFVEVEGYFKVHYCKDFP